jgi:hypothetical protein
MNNSTAIVNDLGRPPGEIGARGERQIHPDCGGVQGGIMGQAAQSTLLKYTGTKPPELGGRNSRSSM